jgi:RimJ/RimL family protein N-acetyltransferase
VIAIVKNPSECTPNELAAFETMVREGEEVLAFGLPERVRRAAFLLHLVDAAGSLIGVSALKRPSVGYRAKVFDKAHSKLQPEDYVLELGWLFIAQPNRGQGLSRTLVENLLPYAGSQRVYATTRESNLPMRRTNVRCGFQKEGDPYLSDDGHYALVLYVR